MSQCGAAQGKPGEPLLQKLQGIRPQPVIHPAPLLATIDQAGFTQHFEVERQLRLGQSQLGSEVAHTPLSLAEGLDHPEPQRLGQSPQQSAGLIRRS